MATVSERLKGTFASAKEQLEDFEKQIVKIEKQAKKSLDDVPGQLRGAWESVVTRLRGALAFATREELSVLSKKVDELAKKVEKLIRGEKIKQVSKDKGGNAKHA